MLYINKFFDKIARLLAYLISFWDQSRAGWMWNIRFVRMDKMIYVCARVLEIWALILNVVYYMHLLIE